MKIYLVSYGCEPNQGGEHEAGWKVANSLKKYYDITVITRTANKDLIQKNNINDIDFIFLENNLFVKFKPRENFLIYTIFFGKYLSIIF